MKIEQIYTGCLAQGAYYIECNGEVAIIDPLREVQPYLDRADRDNARIRFIFETHFHADFVSGHLTLSEKTDAPIIYGPEANPSFKAVIAKDGQKFMLGKATIVVLHTPGHTLESTTYLLRDENGHDCAIFTGDTLFLGDVGRPDLAQKKDGISETDLAGMLYDSLRNKIMPLADELTVYPAHGAGSACGKNMMKQTVDTLGNQKKVNYALRTDMSKEEFIKEVTAGLDPPPAYFPLNVKLNKEGYASFDKVMAQGNRALDVDTFLALAESKNALVLDVRTREQFKEKHIPSSIFIGLDGSFAPWVGALVQDVETPILLIVEDGKQEEAITRLSRVGFDRVLGYLEGGIAAWEKKGREVDQIEMIDAEDIESLMKLGTISLFDVRKPGEYEADHLSLARPAPLSRINEVIADMSSSGSNFIHCQSGYRSVIAASILKSRGIHNVVDVTGGFNSLKETGIPRTQKACSSSLKN